MRQRRQQCYCGDCGKVSVANCKVLQGREDGIEPAKQAKCTLYVKQYHVLGVEAAIFWKLGSRQYPRRWQQCICVRGRGGRFGGNVADRDMRLPYTVVNRSGSRVLSIQGCGLCSEVNP
jgi:hypothetical protein